MILLTGATGRIATAAGERLVQSGIPFRALVRDASKCQWNSHDNVDVFVGDLREQSDLSRALEGVSKTLLVTPNGEEQLSMEMLFADQAAAAGVRHIVKISSMEAGPNVTAAFPKTHYESEQHIKSQPLRWTMVRPNFFMQNFLLFAQGISKANCFALPFGLAKTGMLDANDVGAACANILSTHGHDGETYKLTGTTLLDFHEVAARMSAVLGKEIRYVDQPPDEFREFLGQFVKSEWHLNGVCELFAEIANHSLERVTTTVRELTGQDPAPFEQFVEAHRKVFA